MPQIEDFIVPERDIGMPRRATPCKGKKILGP